MAKIGPLNVQIGVDLNKFRDDTRAAFQILNSTVAKMESSLNELKNTAHLVNTAIAGMIASEVVQKAKEFVKAYAEAESATVKLGSALSATGRYSTQAMDQIKQSAHEVSLATATSGKEIIKATATFSQFAKNLNPRELAEGQKALVGYAKVMDIDLQRSAIQLGKAVAGYSDKIGRSGITIQGAASQHERLNQVLEKTASFYKQAEGESNSMEGQIKKLDIAHHHFEATLGEIIVKSTGTHSAIELMTQVYEKLDECVNRNKETILSWIKILLQMGETTVQIGKVVFHGIAYLVDALGVGVSQSVGNTLKAVKFLVDNSVLEMNAGIKLINLIPGVHVSEINNPNIQSGIDITTRLENRFNSDMMRQAQGVGRNVMDIASGKSIFSGFGKGQGGFNFSFGGADNAYGGKSSSGKSKKGNTDPDIAKAKSAIEAAMLPLEKYQKAIAEADRWLKKHLVTYDQWREIVDKADIDTNKLIKINPGMEDLTKRQRAQVDPTRKFDFGFGTSGSLKEAFDNFIGKPFDQATKTLMEKWQQNLTDMAKGSEIIDSLATPWQQFTKVVAELDRQLDLGNITLEQRNQAYEKAKTNILDNSYIEILKRQTDETARLTTARMRGNKVYEDTTLRIQAENAVRQQGLQLMSQEGQSLYNMTLESLRFQSHAEKMQDAILRFGETGAQVGEMIGGAFEQMIFQGGKFKDVLRQLTLDMAKMVFEKTVVSGLSKGGSKLFSAIGGALFGGKIPGFASGGTTPTNQPFWVGENGPELMSSSRPMHVLDNQSSMALAGAGGGGGVTLNQYFTLQTIDNKDFEDRLYQNAKVIGNMSVQAVQRQSNRMGQRGPMEPARG